MTDQALRAMIAMAKRPARTVEVCLRGDLVADIEDATRQLALAQEFGDSVEAERLASHIVAMKSEMAEAMITVRFEAMPRDKWIALLAENPGRDREPDITLGFNPDSLYPAIIRGSWALPEVEREDIDALLAGLNDGQFSELAEAAFAVNTRGAVVPFGWRGYKPTPS